VPVETTACLNWRVFTDTVRVDHPDSGRRTTLCHSRP